MNIGTFLLMVGLAFGLGVFWYNLLPARMPDKAWRVGVYPFIGIYVAETLLAPALAFDPQFGGIHLISALIGSLVAVVVDWAITDLRHPSLVPWPQSKSATV